MPTAFSDIGIDPYVAAAAGLRPGATSLQDLLVAQNNMLAALVSALAPTQSEQRILISNLAAGQAIPGITLGAGQYNRIRAALTSGTVNIYLGQISPATLIEQFNAAPNPVQIDYILKSATQPIIVQCDTASTNPANGHIDFVVY